MQKINKLKLTSSHWYKACNECWQINEFHFLEQLQIPVRVQIEPTLWMLLAQLWICFSCRIWSVVDIESASVLTADSIFVVVLSNPLLTRFSKLFHIWCIFTPFYAGGGGVSALTDDNYRLNWDFAQLFVILLFVLIIFSFKSCFTSLVKMVFKTWGDFKRKFTEETWKGACQRLWQLLENDFNVSAFNMKK